MEEKVELTKKLEQIREDGVKTGLTLEEILKKMLTFITEYRKRNTLSPAELEKLLSENKELTRRMLERIKKINTLY
jgi:hypothetical protein